MGVQAWRQYESEELDEESNETLGAVGKIIGRKIIKTKLTISSHILLFVSFELI